MSQAGSCERWPITSRIARSASLSGETEGPAEPAAPVVDEAVTRHGFNLHASLTIAAADDLGLRPPFSMSRFRVLSDGRISYRVKKSSRRVSHCRIMTLASCIARLCALIPPPRYPLTRFQGVLAPRAKLRPRIVPKLPESVASASACKRPCPRPEPSEPRAAVGDRPLRRDRSGPVVRGTARFRDDARTRRGCWP